MIFFHQSYNNIGSQKLLIIDKLKVEIFQGSQKAIALKGISIEIASGLMKMFYFLTIFYFQTLSVFVPINKTEQNNLHIINKLNVNIIL